MRPFHLHFCGKISSQITTVTLFSTDLSVAMTTRLWSCMALFDNLRVLYLNNATLSVSDADESPYSALPSLPSVRKLEAWSLTENTFRLLTGCIPAVEEMVVWIGNDFDLDHVVSQIVQTLTTVGRTLKWIVINGLLNVNGSRVSLETCGEFGRQVRQETEKLETVCFVEVKVEDEGGMVAIVRECQSVTSIKEIR